MNNIIVESEVISTKNYPQEATFPDSSVVSKVNSATENQSKSASSFTANLSLSTLADDPTYLDALSYVKNLKKVRSTWESTLSKASIVLIYTSKCRFETTLNIDNNLIAKWVADLVIRPSLSKLLCDLR